jgi:phosphoribosylaminoimidazole-succinocarboxamide synthase
MSDEPTPESDLSQPSMAGARHVHSGKVRDLYELADGRLLMVASDRISAYDFVLEPAIPDKGEILTRMSLWWFEQLRHIVPNHVLSTDVPAEAAGRGLICERLAMLPIECVARGYLAGSGWAEYQSNGAVCGIPLPDGLTESARLELPIFTPAAKAAVGDHDENIDYQKVVETIGADLADTLRTLTLTIYGRAEEIARERGIILADTKFEFGLRDDGTVVLADEVLTPDSSRFWPADEWEPGRSQRSYDKQYVRDWLTSAESGWDRASGAPPPALPEGIVAQTRATYVEAYERLTGESF